jgi:hypothetical protein
MIKRISLAAAAIFAIMPLWAHEDTLLKLIVLTVIFLAGCIPARQSPSVHRDFGNSDKFTLAGKGKL